MLGAIGMKNQWIAFISSYCDSWCERCAFTERCSTFAVQSAVGMCDGDAEAALELTFGHPRRPGGPPPKVFDQRVADAIGGDEPSAKELDEIGREMDERRERTRRIAIAEVSLDYAIAAQRWLTAHEHAVDAEPVVTEALKVVSWDSFLIHVKIMRALDGRDEDLGSLPFDNGDPQSDWNGSAKVALLSIERSEASWRTIAAPTGDEAAGVLAHTLAQLKTDLLKEFPRAMQFRRPGFDG
jgi:hypothetical protein